MLGQFSLVAVFAMTAAMAGSSLPHCASKPHLCQCPRGTTLQNSTTYAIIGAPATDVKAIIGSFFHTEWFGENPSSVAGKDNTPGCSRVFTGATDVGTYTFVEEVVTYEEDKDGSFSVLFEQANGPIPYDDGSGSFAGYWDTIEVIEADAYETLVYWDIYACFTGEVTDFAGFHESGINNVTAILRDQGKLIGRNMPPTSF